jgi:molybdenum cofactor synthesis domain
MLTYDEALERVLNVAGGPLPKERVALAAARGRALARDVTAAEDLPPFDNSSVDGYAFRSEDLRPFSPGVVLPVSQVIPAGATRITPLAPGTAARIFTGAPVPPGADAVVMQEDTENPGGDTGQVLLRDAGSAAYIRRAGSDVARGTVALTAGTTLDAGAVGLLAALNVTDAPCTRVPRVALLTTGDEVIPPGSAPLAPGQIRDANGPALAAAVAEAGAELAVREHAADTEASVRAALAACQGCDVIVSSGGVSVGDHDHVKAVAEEMGVLHFWRIAIKPGKPLAFGRVGGALFFGLPGNPVSSLVTFELFVRPVLRRLAGHAQVLRPRTVALLTADLPHAPGRREFVRARVEWRAEDGACLATPTGAQGSHRLASLVGANALLVAHEDRGDYAAGESLPALLLS